MKRATLITLISLALATALFTRGMYFSTDSGYGFIVLPLPIIAIIGSITTLRTHASPIEKVIATVSLILPIIAIGYFPLFILTLSQG